MGKKLEITDEQRAVAARNIENGFMFTEDVLTDPTLLDQIPDGAEVIAIPKDECDPTHTYDVETRRMVATIIPPDANEQGHHARRHVANT